MSARAPHPPRATRPRDAEATRSALVAAAAAELEDVGYDGTNTNRIARRAGYAPQSFYRHFETKLDAFLAVYRAWVDAALEQVVEAADPASIARRLVEHHRRARGFRRALRALAVTDPRVRALRATERQRQIERLVTSQPSLASRPFDDLVASLLTIERMVDALVEGELEDLGMDEKIAHRRLATVVERELLGPPPGTRPMKPSGHPRGASKGRAKE